MSWEAFAIITVALVIGSFGKAITGFGLPMIAGPVIAAFISVEHAVAVMVVPAAVTNVWLMWEHRKQAVSLRNAPLIVAGGVAGAAAGTWLLDVLDERVLGLVMACWIAVYLASLRTRRGLPVPRDRLGLYVPGVASVSGLFQGAVGFAGPVLVPGMHALRLAPGAHVFALSAIFLVFGITQMIALAGFGMMTPDRLAQGVYALAPVLIATRAGIWLSRRIDRRTFDACIMALLAAMGLKLAWQSVAGF